MSTKKPAAKPVEAKLKLKIKGSPEKIASGLKAIVKKK